MNIEEMQKEENFEHEVLDRLKCLDPMDFDYNAVDGSYVGAVLKARDIILTAYEKEKEKNKKAIKYCKEKSTFQTFGDFELQNVLETYINRLKHRILDILEE